MALPNCGKDRDFLSKGQELSDEAISQPIVDLTPYSEWVGIGDPSLPEAIRERWMIIDSATSSAAERRKRTHVGYDTQQTVEDTPS